MTGIGTAPRRGWIAAAALALAAFGPIAAPTGALAQTVKVGLVLPLTGNTAWGGRPAELAGKMAADEVNKAGLAGQFKIELVTADGVCDPRSSYAAADKLISENEVQILIGEYCSSASIAAAQVATDNKVPMLVHISTADGIAKNAGSYVFQSSMQNRDIQEREGKLLLEKFKFKTAAILVENNDFGLTFRDNMKRVLEKAGVRIVMDAPQDRSDANWYSTITQIKGANPDILVVSISAVQAANFIKQYAEAGLQIPLFSDYPPPPYILEKQVGEQAAKIGLVRGAFYLSKDPTNTEKQKEYAQKFAPAAEKLMGEPRPAVYWDAATYDAVHIVADALKRAGSAKAPDVLKALAATKLDGVLGHYEFSADREVKPEGLNFYFIKNEPNGDLVEIK